MTSSPSALMPVVFFGHGSPTIARETNAVTRTSAYPGTTLIP